MRPMAVKDPKEDAVVVAWELSDSPGVLPTEAVVWQADIMAVEAVVQILVPQSRCGRA